MSYTIAQCELLSEGAQVLDYTKLVETTQLSAARILRIQGALQAASFDLILKNKTPEERREIVDKVGGEFDRVLVNYVLARLIDRTSNDVAILAEDSDGVGGFFPWQATLEEGIARVNVLNQSSHITLRVVRYTADAAIN